MKEHACVTVQVASVGLTVKVSIFAMYMQTLMAMIEYRFITTSILRQIVGDLFCNPLQLKKALLGPKMFC